MNKEVDKELFNAVKSSNLEKVKIALKSGADVNAKDKNKENALIYASQDDSLDIVKELLKNGAKIDFKGEQGWTPLRYAVDKGKNQIAVYLIENGADINSKDKNGQTPLYGAVLKRNEKIIRLLTEKGANVNASTKGNSSALMVAVTYPNNLAVVKQLVEAGADLTFQPLDVLSTAIFASANYGETEVLNYLLDSGMKFFSTFADGTSIVEFLEKFYSKKIGTKDVIKLLKKNG